jgi:hypothetical protein
MKKILTAAAIGAFAIASATPVLAMDPATSTGAQTTQSQQTQPASEMPDTSMEQTGAIGTTPLETGENSFTEQQAKERFEAAGLSGVTGLKLDEQGIWRAKATKGATTMSVGLDYKGNIATDTATSQ